MSWYIKNWILPKEGKEIQESIKNYLRDGGSLNSRSLPKKLISKRKSVKVHDANNFGQNTFNYQDYSTPAYKDYLKNTVKNVDGCLMPIKVMSTFNPELKNLNLKAVENIVLQKIIEEKNSRSNHMFMKHRKAKYRSRLNTAQ